MTESLGFRNASSGVRWACCKKRKVPAERRRLSEWRFYSLDNTLPDIRSLGRWERFAYRYRRRGFLEELLFGIAGLFPITEEAGHQRLYTLHRYIYRQRAHLLGLRLGNWKPELCHFPWAGGPVLEIEDWDTDEQPASSGSLQLI